MDITTKDVQENSQESMTKVKDPPCDPVVVPPLSGGQENKEALPSSSSSESSSSSAESDSDSDSDSDTGDDSSEENDELEYEKNKKKVDEMIQREGVEEENSIFGPLTKNEKPRTELQLPPLPKEIQSDEDIEIVGEIMSVQAYLNSLVVRSIKIENDNNSNGNLTRNNTDVKAFDMDSVLCLEDRTCIGRIEDVFGPVNNPFYVVRLMGRFSKEKNVKSSEAIQTQNENMNQEEEKISLETVTQDKEANVKDEQHSISAAAIMTKDKEENVKDEQFLAKSPAKSDAEFKLKPGMKLYVIKKYGKEIDTQKLNTKGSDASNLDNEEPKETELEYSDDEQESLAKRARKGRKHTIVSSHQNRNQIRRVNSPFSSSPSPDHVNRRAKNTQGASMTPTRGIPPGRYTHNNAQVPFPRSSPPQFYHHQQQSPPHHHQQQSPPRPTLHSYPQQQQFCQSSPPQPFYGARPPQFSPGQPPQFNQLYRNDGYPQQRPVQASFDPMAYAQPQPYPHYSPASAAHISGQHHSLDHMYNHVSNRSPQPRPFNLNQQKK